MEMDSPLVSKNFPIPVFSLLFSETPALPMPYNMSCGLSGNTVSVSFAGNGQASVS
jgi:hypothetical protein